MSGNTRLNVPGRNLCDNLANFFARQAIFVESFQLFVQNFPTFFPPGRNSFSTGWHLVMRGRAMQHMPRTAFRPWTHSYHVVAKVGRLGTLALMLFSRNECVASLIIATTTRKKFGKPHRRARRALPVKLKLYFSGAALLRTFARVFLGRATSFGRMPTLPTT